MHYPWKDRKSASAGSRENAVIPILTTPPAGRLYSEGKERVMDTTGHTRQAVKSVKEAISHVDLDAATEQAKSGLEKLKNLPQNVGEDEKRYSVLAGSAIGALALTRLNRVSGWLMLGTAAGLIIRGTTGHCSMYSALGINTKHK
jgi:hypothetical protein